MFHEELGTFSGRKAEIHVGHVRHDTIPQYCKARPVTCALRDKLEREFERLQEEGTIEPVQFAD